MTVKINNLTKIPILPSKVPKSFPVLDISFENIQKPSKTIIKPPKQALKYCNHSKSLDDS